MRLRLALPACLLVVLASPSAHANPWDLYGFGPRAMAMGSAFTTLTDDYTATYYNPAGLTARRKVHFGIGLQTALPALNIERSRTGSQIPSSDPPNHYGIALGVLFPLGGKIQYRIAFGIGIYVPTSGLFRLDSVDEQRPQYYLYQSLAEKLVIAPALAFRLSDQFSIGVGLQVLADLMGNASYSADLVNRRLTRRDLRVDLSPAAALTAGILLGPFHGFRFGVSYRGSLALNYSIPAVLNLESLGELGLHIKGVSAWTPNQVTFGASYELPARKVRFALDLTFAHWANAPDPATKVDVDARGEVVDKLGLGSTLDLKSPELPLGAVSTWTPRLGVEWTISENWALRGGYFFRPTPLPKQNGFTNYLDNNTHGFSAGFAWTHPDFLEIRRNPITFELSLLTLYLPNRAAQKSLRNDPVGDVQSNGAVLAIAASVRHDF